MAIPIAAIAQLAGALKPGNVKSTSTSNVASDITASITNYIGDAGSLGGTAGGGASASPSLSDSTGGASWPSFLTGGIPSSAEGLTSDAQLSSGSMFSDPIVLIGGVVVIGAIAYALWGK